MSDIMWSESVYDRDVLQVSAAKYLEKFTEEQRAVVKKCMDLLSQAADVQKWW